ncbi:hypothetical protein ABZZ20_14770 [Streptomyces sp. NPDC006430]|uniref:hypothetical protein n=1 Tax=Streptomyces sp. NPDC006430 TaxID=3154299 RepID=UPI0033A34239
MRLRPTTAALLGALALVLPTAGPSVAEDFGDDGRRTLGRLEYVIDHDERAQIRPADNDTCYELTDTSRRRPATSVRNETESRAVLFSEHGCGGRAERVLEPGDRVNDVKVLSVTFTPVDDDREDHHGRRDERDDDRGDGREENRGDGRGDGREDQDDFTDEDRGRMRDARQDRGRDEARRPQAGRSGADAGRPHHEGGPDLFDSIFKAVG